MQKVTTKITRAGRPCTGIAAFFYPVLAYIKQARFACGETPVTGTTCTQRLLFHTTNYSTKQLPACQEENPAPQNILCRKQGQYPHRMPSPFPFIPDTSCAAASGAQGSGRIRLPDSSRRCRILRGWCAAQRVRLPGPRPPCGNSASGRPGLP